MDMKRGKPEKKDHYLAGPYTTHQPDGIHLEARCTCRAKLEGIGKDKSEAMESLWAKFRGHLAKVSDNE